jgi:hypothetical protein
MVEHQDNSPITLSSTPVRPNLADDLAKSREERAKCFEHEWAGPVAYEPLAYFSIFRALYSSNFASYKLTFVPWLVVVVMIALWTVIYELWLNSPPDPISSNLQGLQMLIGVMGAAITFLLAFRLARAAVRFYDARLPEPRLC